MAKRAQNRPRKPLPYPPVASRPLAPVPGSARSTWLGLALILAASAALGAVAVFEFRGSPFFNFPVIDERSYVDWALSISAGEVAGQAVFYQDPLYPYFLALLFRGFGENYWLVRLLQVAMGAASVAVVFWTGRELGGDRVGLLAALILALYRGLYFFELQILKATLVILLSAVSCALGVYAAKPPRRKRRLLPVGLSLGLLTLLRGNFLALLPLLAVWAWFLAREERWPSRLGRVGFLAAGIGAAILPVTIRNYAVGGEFVITTSQGGANFYIGNSEYADGRYAKLPFVRPNPEFEARDFQAEAERQAGRKLSPREVSAFWFREGLRWDFNHPGAALKLLLHKARLMVHEFEVADNYGFYPMRDIFVPALWVPVLGFGMLWGPALLGVWFWRRDRRALYPALFGGLYALSIIPFFIVDRYRLAVVPMLAVFAAAAVPRILALVRARRLRDLALAGAVLAATWTISFSPLREAREPLGQEYAFLAQVYLETGQPEPAVVWYDRAARATPAAVTELRQQIEQGRAAAEKIIALMARAGTEDRPEELLQIGYELEKWTQPLLAAKVDEKALKLDPDNFMAHRRLGFFYLTVSQIRDLPAALAHLRRALAIKPGDLDTINDIGNCYIASGDAENARYWWEQALLQDPEYRPARQNLERLDER